MGKNGVRVTTCECGGNVLAVKDFDRFFSWCDRCTPVQKITGDIMSKFKAKKSEKKGASTLPKTVYIKRVKAENSTDHYLMVEEDPNLLVEMGESTILGIYTLQNAGRYSGLLKVEPVE